MDKQKFNKALGAKIYAVRKEKGFIRRELGNIVDTSQLSRIEKGERSLPLTTLYSLAKGLDCSVNDLLPTMKEVGL